MGFLAIKGDIDKKVIEKEENINIQLMKCRDEYKVNDCINVHKRPALRDFCFEKEKCMRSLASQLGTSSAATFQLIGEAINSFYDSLSLRNLIFFYSTLFM